MIGLVKNGAACPVTDYRTAELNLYVDPAGDDNNDGLTPLTAFRTIQKAAYEAARPARVYYRADARINLAEGTYAAGMTLFFPLPGVGSVLRVRGAGPDKTIINGHLFFDGAIGNSFELDGATINIPEGGDSHAIGAYYGAVLSIGNVVCRQNKPSGITLALLRCFFGSYVAIDSGVKFICVGTSRPLLATHYGKIDIRANCTIEGAGEFSVLADHMGEIYRVPPANVLSPGGFTGQRYRAVNGGQIHTGGGGANFFPGTVAGSVAAAGVYD